MFSIIVDRDGGHPAFAMSSPNIQRADHMALTDENLDTPFDAW